MKIITRSQWYCQLVDDFLASPSIKQINIELYKSEVKRLEKRYPIVISVGPKVMASKTDQRRHCFVRRTNTGA